MKEMNDRREKEPKRKINKYLFPAALITGGVVASKIIRARAALTPLRIPRVYADSEKEPLYLVGLNVIDVARGRVLHDRVVKLHRGRIEEIKTRKQWERPSGANTIDLDGYYAIPGLINAHCHMTLLGSMGFTTDFLSSLKRQVERNFEECIFHGVTTVRDMIGCCQLPPLFRERVEKNELLGPRCLYAGSIINVKGGYPDYLPSIPSFLEDSVGPFRLNVRGPREAREAVKRMIALGASHIKTAFDDYSLMVGHKPIPTMDDRTLEALVDEASRHGVKVAAHQSYLSGFRRALEFGVESLEHMPSDEHLTDEDISAFIEGGHTIVPTTSVAWAYAFPSKGDPFNDHPMVRRCQEDRLEHIPRLYPSLFEGPMYRANLKYLRDYSDPAYRERLHLLPTNDPQNYTKDATIGLDNLLALHAAGATIGAGNDGGVPVISPANMSLELRILVEVGMTPAEALRSATLVNAGILDREDDLGSIDAGKLADIVILSGNPLKDIRDLERVEGVFREGKLLYRTARLAKSLENQT